MPRERRPHGTMSGRQDGYSRTAPQGSRRRRPAWGWIPALVALVVAVAVIVFVTRSTPDAVAWSRLGSQDVHSLAFGADASQLLFGHHGGASESRDGGRTWQPTRANDDAMGLATAADGSIVIAGHDVFMTSADGGQTWQPISSDLPSLDIHGLARDPSDPARMWAALATGGLYESRDGGASFDQVAAENVLFPVATAPGGTTRLFGVTGRGLVVSDDGGRTFTPRTSPELFPIASLAATPDGATLVAGGPGGLSMSDDGGASWRHLSFAPDAAAVALSADGNTVAVVTRDTDFYRSDDGGRTWPGP